MREGMASILHTPRPSIRPHMRPSWCGVLQRPSLLRSATGLPDGVGVTHHGREQRRRTRTRASVRWSPSGLSSASPTSAADISSTSSTAARPLAASCTTSAWIRATAIRTSSPSGRSKATSGYAACAASSQKTPPMGCVRPTPLAPRAAPSSSDVSPGVEFVLHLRPCLHGPRYLRRTRAPAAWAPQTVCICRVPKKTLNAGSVVECQHCGCRGCAVGDSNEMDDPPPPPPPGNPPE